MDVLFRCRYVTAVTDRAPLHGSSGSRLAQRNRRRVIFLGGAESILNAIQTFPDDCEVRWTDGGLPSGDVKIARIPLIIKI